jgi:hypothetical protein
MVTHDVPFKRISVLASISGSDTSSFAWGKQQTSPEAHNAVMSHVVASMTHALGPKILLMWLSGIIYLSLLAFE